MKGFMTAWLFVIAFVGTMTTHATELAYQQKNYVCYDSRSITRHIDGRNSVTYYGCYLSRSSCYSNGSNHFGAYSNRYSALRALDRCHSGNPRFID